MPKQRSLNQHNACATLATIADMFHPKIWEPGRTANLIKALVSTTITSFASEDKKFELMLMRCTKAYSSSYSQKSSMLIQLKSLSLVLVVINSMAMPICNCFHEKLANNGKITTFAGSTAIRCPCAQVSLNVENWDLDRRCLRSMLKISYLACSCLSQLISMQFALEMCLAARNRQKIHKNPFLVFKVIQGHWIWWQSRLKSQCTTSY